MLAKIALILCFLALQNGASETSNTIHVLVSGLHSDNGQVICSLYSSADGFPKKPENAIAQTKSAITNRHAECVFAGIKPGTYAIAVFHDENSNGKLDTNFFGIPREGVGASNNARARFGPPSFHDASFVYAGANLDLNVAISYL